MFHFNDVFEMIVRDHVSFTLLNFKIEHIEIFYNIAEKRKKSILLLFVSDKWNYYYIHIITHTRT